MNTEAAIVEQLTRGGTPNRAGWINVDCPFCEARVGKIDRGHKLGLNVSTGRFKCFRCGVWGYLRAPESDGPRREPEEAPREFRPPSSYDAPNDDAIVHARGIAYLRQRGIDRSLWRPIGIGLATSGVDAGRVIVPLRDERGEWWGWYGRSWNPRAELPHLYPPGMTRQRMFNEHVLRHRTRTPVMVVEVVLDALPHWPNAVACLGKPGGSQLETLRASCRPVVFCLDGDAWEEGMWHAASLRMDGHPAGFVRLPAGADPNEIEPRTLLAQASAAIEASI